MQQRGESNDKDWTRRCLWLSAIGVLWLCMSPQPSWSAEVSTDTAKSGGDWITLDEFINNQNMYPAPTPATAAPPAAIILPSLTNEKSASALATTAPAVKIPPPVDFAAIPPVFERPKAAPAVVPVKPKPVLAKLNLAPRPDIMVSPGKDTLAAPGITAPTASCTVPEQSKRTKALASDRATLVALQQAVKDLQLNDSVDFMMPPKTEQNAPTGKTELAPSVMTEKQLAP